MTAPKPRSLFFFLCSSALCLAAACSKETDDTTDEDDAGSGGTANATGGGAGSPGDSEEPNTDTFTEVTISPTAGTGWVAAEDNSPKLQGAWYTFQDPGGSTIEETVNDGTKLCVAGQGLQVPTNDEGAPQWRQYWGAGLGWDLCNTGEEGDPPDTKYGLAGCPFNDDLEKTIVGVRFDISPDESSVTIGAGGAGGGTAVNVAGIPPELRLQFAETNRNESTYALVPQTGGEVTVLFEDAKVLYNPGAPPATPELIESVQFQIATSDKNPTPFAFCIENFRVLTK